MFILSLSTNQLEMKISTFKSRGGDMKIEECEKYEMKGSHTVWRVDVIKVLPIL